MDEAIPYFADLGKLKLSDLARKWKMTNRDTEEILKGPQTILVSMEKKVAIVLTVLSSLRLIEAWT